MPTVTELHEPEVREPEKGGLTPRLVPVPVPYAAPALFSEVLLEADYVERRRRIWSALSSVLLQSLLLGFVFLLNGEPVEVETTITVTFKLSV